MPYVPGAPAVVGELPAAPEDRARELVILKRKLTPRQRLVLAELPAHPQFWSLLKRLKISQAIGFKWMRDPVFVRARALLEQVALDRLDINQAYVLGRTKDVVERSMQAEPVRDAEGNETGEYRFEGAVALKGLDMLGRYTRTWQDDRQQAAPVGPGLTVIVQTGGTTTAVQADTGLAGRVVVDLPGPERTP